jgi:ABC-type multidrug transport system permease subunit
VFVNLTILPLTFISNIWFPTDNLPTWLQDIAKLFPIRALADGLQYAFDPRTTGAGFKGSSVLALAIWTVIGVRLMLRFLRKPEGDRA